MNTDGAFSHTSNQAAAGGLFRDDNGKIILAFYKYIGTASILEAKVTTILEGLSFCSDWDCPIVVESDSLIAIQILQNKKPFVNWKLQTLVTNIKLLISSLPVTLSHVYREGIQAADWLASYSLDSFASDSLDPDNLPVPLRKIAYHDKIQTPYLRP